MTPRRRVLHVLFGQTVGGVESLCVDLVRELQRLDLDEEVVFLEPGEGAVRARLAQTGPVPVHTCVYDRSRTARFVWSFSRLVRERHIHTVIVYAFGFHLIAAAAARLGGARRVLAYAGNPPPADATLCARTRRSARIARPFVTREVACSRYVAQQMTERYGLPQSRVAVVPHGCDAESIARRADEIRTTRTDVGPVFGMVSRFDPIKDHVTLARAFARVHAACPGARLLLVGDGSTRPGIEALAASLGIARCVELTGARLDVAAELGRMDVFVMATTPAEGFGVALVEALAAGVAAVASRVGPCPEILDHGRLGILVEPGDDADMAAAMLRLWRDEPMRRRLATEAQAAAAARYNARLLALRYRDLIEPRYSSTHPC